jgi:hypothetical protein
MEYTIVTAVRTEDLITKVNKLLAQGYQVYGNLVVAGHPTPMFFYQVMIKQAVAKKHPVYDAP